MKLWSCDVCNIVVRSDDGVPVGWMVNLIPGVNPICAKCSPSLSKKDLKPEKQP